MLRVKHHRETGGLTVIDNRTGLRLEIDHGGDGIAVECYDYFGRHVEMEPRQPTSARLHPEVWFLMEEPVPEGRFLPED